MPEDINQNLYPDTAVPVNTEMQNLKKLITGVFAKKYFFAGTLFITCLAAYLYNRYTIPFYRVSATILIEENKKAISTGNDQLLEGFGLMPGMRNFDNQMMVLSSRTLVSKTLDELAIDTEFYHKGFINSKSLYPDEPVLISVSQTGYFPHDVEFSIKYLGNDRIRVKSVSKGFQEIDRKISFGERIDIPGVSFTIEKGDAGYFRSKREKTIYFAVHSRRSLIDSYIRRLRIDRASKQGSIVKLSMTGTNRYQDLAFLTKLSEIFLNISLERKNNEAIRTIQFIDDQLSGISDSLMTTENKLQQFRSRNRVMNISAQGQVIINQAVNLENERARLGIEANYYKYLTEYLERDTIGEGPVAPATMGISDPGLTKLVADLADQQSRLYSKGMGEKNPLQNQLSQKVQATKNSLKETLKGLTRANSLAMREIQDQINTVNNQASVLPRTERQLLGIERKYKLNDELYTFLLEKRAIAQMQKASNVADNEMVDYPEYENNPVKPRRSLIYLFALITGLGFPFLYIFLTDLLSIRIREYEEIKKITGIPVLGYIPHFGNKNTTVVLDDPGSPVAEAFRLLRSRMIFFTKDKKVPVILVTSSMPEEGKTFTAINLASAFSLMGKKTILLGFDLRKPKIYPEFNKQNDKGLTTWLIGKSSLDDIIENTAGGNLDIITSGPIPPNPAELTALPATGKLLEILKERYDCIVIDSAPLGTVSDAYHLIPLCDTSIIIVRPGFTVREILENTVKDLKTSRVENMTLVINDMNIDHNRYGYGLRYGYTQNNPKNGRNNKKAPVKVESQSVKVMERTNKN